MSHQAQERLSRRTIQVTVDSRARRVSRTQLQLRADVHVHGRAMVDTTNRQIQISVAVTSHQAQERLSRRTIQVTVDSRARRVSRTQLQARTVVRVHGRVMILHTTNRQIQTSVAVTSQQTQGLSLLRTIHMTVDSRATSHQGIRLQTGHRQQTHILDGVCQAKQTHFLVQPEL